MVRPTPAVDVVPDGLLDYPHWVCWRTQSRDGKQTKVPVDPQSGGYASTTDAETWGTFTQATAYVDTDNAAGVGFVFTEDDPFVGIDLDDCRAADTGEVDEWARHLIDRLDSYTEVSPSGTGLHILVRGSLPAGRNRRGDVEMYDRARFFTVTGDRIGERHAIRERSAALAAVHAEYVHVESAETRAAADDGQQPGRPAIRSAATQGTPGDRVAVDDATLIERARTAANGEKFDRLWRGDTTGYESHSEADMALCSLLAFWTGADAARMDRLFRRSDLMREKWDEQHYADGSTYGEKTIERAIACVDDTYDPRAGDSDTVPEEGTPRGGAAEQPVLETHSREASPNTNRDATAPEATGMAAPESEPGAPDVQAAQYNVSALVARLDTLETVLLNPPTASEEVVRMIELKRKKTLCAQGTLPLRQTSRLDSTKTY